MKNVFRTSVIALLLIGTACTGQAQEEERKIKVQISKYVDGEEKVFKGEYANEEEMRNDPAYREFAGDDDGFSFVFKGDDFDKIIELHRGPGGRAFSFDFDDEDFAPMKHMRRLHFDGGRPGVFMFGDEEAMGRMHMFDAKEYEAEMEAKMKELEEKMKGLDKTLQEDIMRSMREIEEMNSNLIPRMTKRGGISVEEVGTDFGKRGAVEEKDKLELRDIDFMVMQKRLNLRFRVQDAGELAVKISTEAGKDIYSRYFENFNGSFSDQIDFNTYSSGKYLLEISQGKKRLTKKLVIE
jgi:hypothetical protein